MFSGNPLFYILCLTHQSLLFCFVLVFSHPLSTHEDVFHVASSGAKSVQTTFVVYARGRWSVWCEGLIYSAISLIFSTFPSLNLNPYMPLLLFMPLFFFYFTFSFHYFDFLKFFHVQLKSRSFSSLCFYSTCHTSHLLNPINPTPLLPTQCFPRCFFWGEIRTDYILWFVPVGIGVCRTRFRVLSLWFSSLLCVSTVQLEFHSFHIQLRFITLCTLLLHWCLPRCLFGAKSVQITIVFCARGLWWLTVVHLCSTKLKLSHISRA